MSRADTQAFNELIALLQTAGQQLLNERNQRDDIDLAEGYRHILDLTAIGIDLYLDNDPERPRFSRIVYPWRKMGGDNAHALYDFAPLCGDRDYRITGNKADTCYLAFTTYGGASAEKVDIHVNLNHSQMVFDEDGDFELLLTTQPEGKTGNVIALKPDTHSLIVRQYFHAIEYETEALLLIEPVAGLSPPAPESAASMARRIQSLVSFLKGWFAMSPIPWPDDIAAYNQPCPPFQASASTGHWSTPDNIHSFGFFKLKPDEALILRGTSPDCLYWSCHLWNSCMQTFDFRYFQCALSDQDVELNDDGSWELIIAHSDPGKPNWLETAGHEHGFIYFRWLQVAAMPGAIEAEVVKVPVR
ncbi:MAG: DUF1214 domain-containing protein [Gammaproteobacteria bacterium]|nr:MAG: DUF1214 domain-containing protein [Gammaproteobacteria bacterium]